jgi:hypothetical protein
VAVAVTVQTRNHRYVARSHKRQSTKKDCLTKHSDSSMYVPTPCSVMYLVKDPELCRVSQGELLSAGLSKHPYTDYFFPQFSYDMPCDDDVKHGTSLASSPMTYYKQWKALHHFEIRLYLQIIPLWHFITVLLFVAGFVYWRNVYPTEEGQNNCTARKSHVWYKY